MKFTGLLMNLDGQPDSFGDIFEADCEIEFAKEVKVFHEFNYEPDSFIGVATLTREPQAIRYEIDVKVETFPKEVLDRLYPCAGGSVIKRDGEKITKCRCYTIGLCIDGNDDLRIKPLGEQK